MSTWRTQSRDARSVLPNSCRPSAQSDHRRCGRRVLSCIQYLRLAPAPSAAGSARGLTKNLLVLVLQSMARMSVKSGRLEVAEVRSFSWPLGSIAGARSP